MSDQDVIQGFLFSESTIRGKLVGLSEAYQKAIENHAYPDDVKKLLGEFLAAAALLSTTIRFDGSLILQVKCHGRLKFIMAECRNQRYLRAIARYDPDLISTDQLIGEGQLAITIEPDKGQAYQGIVELEEGSGLAAALEKYFKQSEQINTRIILTSDTMRTAGLLLQMLPEEKFNTSSDEDMEYWLHVTQLANTVSDTELLNDGNERLLRKLFHEETIRLFKPAPLIFKCSCSIERSGNALLSLGEDEAKALLLEQTVISIDCQFCFASYEFDENDVARLFKGAVH